MKLAGQAYNQFQANMNKLKMGEMQNMQNEYVHPQFQQQDQLKQS
jgi:hypothetical protein